MATPGVQVVRWRLCPSGWPHGARLRIALLADLHLCQPWTPIRVAEAAIDAVHAEAPDLILLLGDYAAHLPFGTRYAPETVARSLSRLAAPLGVFNVFGNHDWWTDRAGCRAEPPMTQWHRAFEAAGIETVENRSVSLDHEARRSRWRGWPHKWRLAAGGAMSSMGWTILMRR